MRLLCLSARLFVPSNKQQGDWTMDLKAEIAEWLAQDHPDYLSAERLEALLRRVATHAGNDPQGDRRAQTAAISSALREQ